MECVEDQWWWEHHLWKKKLDNGFTVRVEWHNKNGANKQNWEHTHTTQEISLSGWGQEKVFFYLCERKWVRRRQKDST